MSNANPGDHPLQNQIAVRLSSLADLGLGSVFPLGARDLADALPAVKPNAFGFIAPSLRTSSTPCMSSTNRRPACASRRTSPPFFRHLLCALARRRQHGRRHRSSSSPSGTSPTTSSTSVPARATTAAAFFIKVLPWDGSPTRLRQLRRWLRLMRTDGDPSHEIRAAAAWQQGRTSPRPASTCRRCQHDPRSRFRSVRLKCVRSPASAGPARLAFCATPSFPPSPTPSKRKASRRTAARRKARRRPPNRRRDSLRPNAAAALGAQQPRDSRSKSSTISANSSRQHELTRRSTISTPAPSASINRAAAAKPAKARGGCRPICSFFPM